MSSEFKFVQNQHSENTTDRMSLQLQYRIQIKLNNFPVEAYFYQFQLTDIPSISFLVNQRYSLYLVDYNCSLNSLSADKNGLDVCIMYVHIRCIITVIIIVGYNE